MREMKDSGIEWIGDIPEDWNICKTKNIFAIKKIIANKLGYNILSVTQNGLKIKDISNNEGQISSDYSKYQIVDKLDFVMNHMDLLTGWVDCASMQGVTSPDYRVFRLINNILCDRKYYTRIFQLCYQQKLYFSIGQGVSNLGRWRLQTDKFQNFELPLPPFVEQTSIANYLDNKCGKIDVTIQREKQHIEKLKEYRQSVITEAVTKGLDPTVPMKDSGIEWIGEVPQGWEIVQLKTLLDGMKNGTTATQIEDETEYKVTRIETISDGIINYDKLGNIKYFTGLHNYELRIGDILLSHINSLEKVGNAAIYDGCQRLYSGMNLLRLIPKENINSKWLLYFIKSSYFISTIRSVAKHAINQVSVSIGRLNQTMFIRPTLPEQTTIADYLDHKTARIDSAIAKKEMLIERLTEYKKSLIYEAVTGKVEVS